MEAEQYMFRANLLEGVIGDTEDKETRQYLLGLHNHLIRKAHEAWVLDWESKK